MEEFAECMEKQAAVKSHFASCNTLEDKYKMIIELGRKNKPLDPEYKIPENEVPGCQSIMYLRTWVEGDRIYFHTESDALVSAGLAVLMTEAYSGLKPEDILKCPPKHIEELDIHATLSPNRSNGLYSIHLKMKQEAIKFLTKQ